jgi:NitT/TauT family transport system substrate-binding protein
MLRSALFKGRGRKDRRQAAGGQQVTSRGKAGGRRVRFGVRAALALGLALAAATSATGCARPASGDDRPVLKIAYADSLDAAPLLVAEAASRKAPPSSWPFRIEAVRMRSAADVGAALSAGEASMAILPVVEAAAVLEKGAPVTIVSAVSESYGRDGVFAGASVESLDQLAGRKVGVSSLEGAFYAWTMLSRAGLDPAAVTIETKSAPKVLAGLRSGAYDAAVLSGPDLARAARTGSHQLFTTKDFPGILTDALVVLRPYADAHQDVVAKATREIGRAAATLKKSPRSAIASVGETSMSAAALATALKTVRFLDTADSSSMLGIVGQPGPLSLVAADALSYLGGGQDTPAPDASGFIDSRFVNPKT